MIENVLLIIIGAVVGVGFTLIILMTKYNEILTKNIKQQKEYAKIYQDYDNLVNKYNILVNKHNDLLRKSKHAQANTELKDAIRFAMIQSHPDKGICKDSELFIKFRKLYKDVS